MGSYKFWTLWNRTCLKFGHCNNSGKELQIKKLVFLLMKLLGPPNCLIWTKSTSAAPHNRWVVGIRRRHATHESTYIPCWTGLSGKIDTPSKKSKISYLLLCIMLDLVFNSLQRSTVTDTVVHLVHQCTYLKFKKLSTYSYKYLCDNFRVVSTIFKRQIIFHFI